MTVGADEILALHRELVAIPSVSGEEAAVAEHVASWLGARGVACERIGGSVVAQAGAGPVLLLDTHLDTVPAAPGWSRDPWQPWRESGRVHGLGANDAKASVAAMSAAFVSLARERWPFRLTLALVEGEETKGIGTETVLAALTEREQGFLGAVFGEPTGLEVAIAQKGLLVLELVAHGDACHAAHAGRLGARNAAVELARDLVALSTLDLGPPHPLLGAATLTPTVVQAGTARNVVPAEARAVLDVRTVPVETHAETIARVQRAAASDVRVLSSRLEPRETSAGEQVVRAALAANPGARPYGSPTLSDLVFARGIPAIKCGPGESERSHTPDEFVLEEEILAGAAFYERFVRECADLEIAGEGGS